MSEEITNGGFETGDFTGWDAYDYETGSGLAYQNVQSTTKHSGTYAAKFENTATGSDKAVGAIEQIVDFTDVDTLSFYVYIPTYTHEADEDSFVVLIDMTEEYRKEASNGGWELVEIDTSGYTGELILTFRVRCNYVAD